MDMYECEDCSEEFDNHYVGCYQHIDDLEEMRAYAEEKDAETHTLANG